MKETTITVLVVTSLTAGLIALGAIPGESWQYVATGSVLAKGAQGTADRWGGRANK